MATAIDPKAKKILDELRGLASGTGAGTPIDAGAQAILAELKGQAKRLQPPAPPPIVVQEQPQPPRKYPVSPAGYTIDPVTGLEMRRDRPPPHPPQPADTRLLEKGLKAAAEYAFKPLTAPFDPLTAGLNAAVDEGLKAEATGGPVAGFVGFFRGLVTKAPRAAARAVTAPPTTPTFISKPLRAEGAHPIVAEGAQLVASTLFTDPAAARLWGGLLGFAGRRAGHLADVRGLLDKPIPGLGKTARTLQQERQVRQVAKQAFVKGDALAGTLKREGDQVLRQVEKIWLPYKRRGVNLAGTGPTGARVNLADELTKDWIEAGIKDARYSSRGAVEAEARRLGIDVSDLRKAGMLISNTYVKSGRWLEKVGLLKPGTVQKFGGRYAKLMYHYASHNPEDIETALRVAEELDAIGPQAVALGQKVLRKHGGGIGIASLQARKGLTVEQRMALGEERQAGVVMAAALPKQARLGARGEALRQISQNPELFIPLQRTEERAAQVAPEAAERLAELARGAQQRHQQASQALQAFEKEIIDRAHARGQEAINALQRYEAEIAAAGGLRKMSNARRQQVVANVKRLRQQAAEATAGPMTVEQALQRLYRPADRVAFRQKWQTLKAAEGEAAQTVRQATAETGKAARLTKPTTAQVPTEAPPGWVLKKVGPVEGYFHPVALDVIEAAGRPAATGAARLLQQVAGTVRSFWATYNPAVQLGNLKQNLALTEGSAAARGIRWTPPEIAAEMRKDAVILSRALKGEIRDPAFEALAIRSRAFTGEAGMLGEVGQSLRSAIGIDTTAQQVGKVLRRVAGAPREFFGRAEELFKYSLFKKLVKHGIDEDEAARIVDRALFDHSDVDGRVSAMNKYGLVPFLPTRLKGLENSLAIWLKNPDILLRHSGLRLGQAAYRASTPEAQAREQIPRPGGQLPLYLPGMTDAQGRPLYLTGQLFSQSPFQALNPELNDPFAGGVFGPAYRALTNYDPFRREITQGKESFIVKPGEIPPLDAILERVRFAVEGTVPTLTPMIGRESRRIGLAARGETRFGGPFQEPEPLSYAILGGITGIRIRPAAETEKEAMARGARQVLERMPNQRFLNEYLMALRNGQAQPDTFPEWYLPKDAKTTNIWYKNALESLSRYVVGGQGKPDDPKTQATIRRLASWLFQLERRMQELRGRGMELQELIEAPRSE